MSFYRNKYYSVDDLTNLVDLGPLEPIAHLQHLPEGDGGTRVTGSPPCYAWRGVEVHDAFLDELTKPPVAASVDDPELAGPLHEGDYERALQILLDRAADPESRDGARRLMVELFGEIGQDHPLAVQYRKRLAALIY